MMECETAAPQWVSLGPSFALGSDVNTRNTRPSCLWMLLLLLPGCAEEASLLGGFFIVRDEGGLQAHEIADVETTCSLRTYGSQRLELDVEASDERPSLRLTMDPYPPTIETGVYHWASDALWFQNRWYATVDDRTAAPLSPCELTLIQYPDDMEVAHFECGTLSGRLGCRVP